MKCTIVALESLISLRSGWKFHQIVWESYDIRSVFDGYSLNKSSDLKLMEMLSRVSPIIQLQWNASLSSNQTCALQTPQKHHTVFYGMLGKPRGGN